MLSVIIPTYNRKELTARAVRSILEQDTQLQTEIIVTDDGSKDGTPDYLKQTFFAEVSSGKLRVVSFPNCGDCGEGRNRGVRLAKGDYYAFLDSDDYWKPGRLQRVEPLIGKKDLILEAPKKLPPFKDLVSLFISTNWGIVSSSIMSKELFQAVGGFPQGYYKRKSQGKGYARIPGCEDYETWLRSILYLQRQGKLDRVAVLDSDRYVAYEPQAGGLGSWSIRLQMVRETMTLLRVARDVPAPYWPQMLRRLAGAGKAIVFT